MTVPTVRVACSLHWRYRRSTESSEYGWWILQKGQHITTQRTIQHTTHHVTEGTTQHITWQNWQHTIHLVTERTTQHTTHHVTERTAQHTTHHMTERSTQHIMWQNGQHNTSRDRTDNTTRHTSHDRTENTTFHVTERTIQHATSHDRTDNTPHHTSHYRTDSTTHHTSRVKAQKSQTGYNVNCSRGRPFTSFVTTTSVRPDFRPSNETSRFNDAQRCFYLTQVKGSKLGLKHVKRASETSPDHYRVYLKQSTTALLHRLRHTPRISNTIGQAYEAWRRLLTFRLLMSCVYMEHPFLMFLDRKLLT